jgi:hypothetical protein
VEHRWGKRVSLDLTVTLDWGVSKGLAGRLRDVSLSGGYIQRVRLIPLWAEVYVELQGLTGTQGESDRVKGYVVRSEPNGVALEWADFAPRAVRRIVAAFDGSAIAAVNARKEYSRSDDGVCVSRFFSRQVRDPLQCSDLPPASTVQGLRTAPP